MAEYSLVKDAVVVTMVDGELIYQPLLRFEGNLVLGPMYEPETPEDLPSVYREGRDAITARGGLKKLDLRQRAEPEVPVPASSKDGMRKQAITHDAQTGQAKPDPKTESKKNRSGGGPRSMK